MTIKTRPTRKRIEELELELHDLKFKAAETSLRIERLDRLIKRAGAGLANGNADEEDSIIRDIFLEQLGMSERQWWAGS